MSASRPPVRAVLFDLDGTLIDHFHVIYRCLVHAQQQLGLPGFSFEKVKATVGGSVPVTCERLMGKEHAPAAQKLFEDHFDRIFLEDVQAMPGASWLLEALHAQGIRQAVFTNKRGEPSRALCHHMGFDRWLDFVVGTRDTPYRKPQPEFTRHMLELLGTTPEETILVGDSPFDIEAGAVVGMPCYVVATGSHTREQLLAAKPAPAGVYADFYGFGQAVFGLTPPARRESMPAVRA